MKEIALKIILLVSSALLIASCVSRQSDVKDDATDTSQQLCGGFTEQRELTEEEMDMFRYVTGTGEMVFTPLSVSTQVVAGINYRFWCRVNDLNNTENNPGHCWVMIFKPLPGQGEPRLTSIEKQEP